MPAELTDPMMATIKDAADKLTATSVRQALIGHKGYRPKGLPSKRTVRRILNRLGFRLRRVQKTKPVKKIKEIERCWGVLEMHWNGTLLDTIEKALAWAKTMTWKGIQPVVRLLNQVYETGVRLTKAALKPYHQRLERSKTLPKWGVSIRPQQPTLPAIG